ncbi:uncharacterized protein GLRG_10779 [Colletotrichum graminicola M1.001]|uniref:Uncharacterized protein n=1 Tax=Colletotrichum graminicola (strain M1.001 / M2 / FGSC 10212) TaxID=645133 RepID=E3QXT4_COLGM|nr:uncharacterized protein GLRG_10779 [Colletotrichum graminicola M1.001]EFQ35635.1 hypothetical protein GLRG_10779 [Colletotrichum graminicola M1.001]
MVSTNLIRLITSAAILAGVNGQVVTTIAITTITLTTFTTVGLSSSPSSTADPSTTTIPSTTPLGVIPITIRTTITILLPGLNRTSSSVAILPAFTSPNNNVTITSVSTVPTYTLAVRLFQPLQRYPNQHHVGRLILHPRRDVDALRHWRSHTCHKVIRKHNKSLQQPFHLFLEPFRCPLKPRHCPLESSPEHLQASLEHT